MAIIRFSRREKIKQIIAYDPLCLVCNGKRLRGNVGRARKALVYIMPEKVAGSIEVLPGFSDLKGENTTTYHLKKIQDASELRKEIERIEEGLN